MKHTITTLMSVIVIAIFLTSTAFSQVNLKTDPRFSGFKNKMGDRKFPAPVIPEKKIGLDKKKFNSHVQVQNTDLTDTFIVQQEWAERYISPYSDFAVDLALDGAGNVYVLGYDYNEYVMVLIKYNSSGDSVWVVKRSFGGQAIKVDGFGNVYVTGDDSNACLIKYNSSGIEEWAQHFIGPMSYDYYTSLVLDASGNIYVSGYSFDTGWDMIAAKYNSAGDSLWVHRYAQPGNSDFYTFPIPIALDASGNVFITDLKEIDFDIPDGDYVTVKINSNGVQWAMEYDAEGSIDFPNDITTDNSGNVFVTGGISYPDFSTSYGTVKYNSAGVQQWARRHDYSYNGGVSVKADNAGNIYVTGGSNDKVPGFYEDFVTIKYNTDGDSLRVDRYGGIINSGDYALVMTLDGYDNVYVSGATSSLNDLWWEFGTVAYDSSGKQLWVERYAGTDSGNNYTRKIAADNNGNVYVTGSSDGDGTYQDIATIKYYQPNVSPVELSSFTFQLHKRDVELNWVTSSETNNVGFEIERSAIKDQIPGEWAKAGFMPGKGTTTNSNIYSFTDRGLNTGRYKYRLKQIDYNGNFEYFNLGSEVALGVPDKFMLSQNYPNPFNPSTKINYDIPVDGNVSIVLFDLSGREVAKLVNEIQTAGYYTVTFNAVNLSSGIYFYRFNFDGPGRTFGETKKLTFIK